MEAFDDILSQYKIWKCVRGVEDGNGEKGKGGRKIFIGTRESGRHLHRPFGIDSPFRIS